MLDQVVKPQYRQRLLAPLLNAKLTRCFQVETNNIFTLSIVGVSDEQRRTWKADSRVQFITERLSNCLDDVTSGVALEASYPGDILANDHANENFTALIGLISARLPYCLWTPFAEVELMRGERFTIAFIDTRPPSVYERGVTLDLSDGEVFRHYWNSVTGPSPQQQRLRRAISRAMRAGSSYYAEDAIVHAFIGLEALFADHRKDVGKLVKKVQRRVTTFILPSEISPTVEELTRLSNRISELYDIRHDILHGDLPDESKTNEAAKDSIQLLRTSILVALEEGFGRLSDLGALAANYDNALRTAARAHKRKR